MFIFPIACRKRGINGEKGEGESEEQQDLEHGLYSLMDLYFHVFI